MKVFIAGICGTFMAGIAQLARHAGHEVVGCDEGVYPPMSTVLQSHDIQVLQGYLPEHLGKYGGTDFDHIIIGNALARGNPLIEFILDKGKNYCSGPQWLSEHVLTARQVLAIAGTHGKTTTSAIAAWILEHAKRRPGFLIGGKPGNFDDSARAGLGEWFVIEADEYDSAFFDKRSKFIHYRPRIAVLNNLEFDHADIFADVNQIKTQFHHLIRTIPQSGSIIVNKDDQNLAEVLQRGCWSQRIEASLMDANAQWYAHSTSVDCRSFEVFQHGNLAATVVWDCLGKHNMHNALMAIAATHCAGVEIATAADALSTFIPPARRLQLLYADATTILYEDFAHHPTAIQITLETLKNKYPDKHLIALIEPRSNSMVGGHFVAQMATAMAAANEAWFYTPVPLDWDPQDLNRQDIDRRAQKSGVNSGVNSGANVRVFTNAKQLLETIRVSPNHTQVIVCMSNGGFDQIPARLKEQLIRDSV